MHNISYNSNKVELTLPYILKSHPLLQKSDETRFVTEELKTFDSTLILKTSEDD